MLNPTIISTHAFCVQFAVISVALTDMEGLLYLSDNINDTKPLLEGKPMKNQLLQTHLLEFYLTNAHAHAHALLTILIHFSFVFSFICHAKLSRLSVCFVYIKLYTLMGVIERFALKHNSL